MAAVAMAKATVAAVDSDNDDRDNDEDDDNDDNDDDVGGVGGGGGGGIDTSTVAGKDNNQLSGSRRNGGGNCGWRRQRLHINSGGQRQQST